MLSGKMIRLLLYASLAVILLLVGACSTKIEDPPLKNNSPRIEIVNIPPNHSHFTSNPRIYWFGTDQDGYIIGYEYAIVLDSLIPASVNKEDSVALVAWIDSTVHVRVEGSPCDPGSCWQVVDVQAGENPANQTINLLAGTDPADTVTQFFFVRAMDNDSARSRIEYRIYSRNNNPPNTEIKTFPDSLGYYDHPETTSTYKGISFEWKGTDKIDYPNEAFEPEFDYSYQLFGPFDSSEVPWKHTYLDTGRTTRGPDSVDVALFDTSATWVKSKLRLTSSDATTGAIWVKQTSTRLFNLWGDGGNGVTRDAYFVLRVTARDDARAPDPTPACVAIHAIDPQFENDLMLFVNSNLIGSCGKPNSIECFAVDSVLNFYKDVFAEAGYSDPFFYTGEAIPSKAILGKYAVCVLLSDGDRGGSTFTTALYSDLAKYMDMGGNVWLWGVNSFAAYAKSSGQGLKALGPSATVPVKYFGILAEYFCDWFTSYVTRFQTEKPPFPMRNEQFTGATAINLVQPEGFRDFDIDKSKLRSYFIKPDSISYPPRCLQYDTLGNCVLYDTICVVRDESGDCQKWVTRVDTVINEQMTCRYVGAPYVNYEVKDVFAEALLLFKSYYGDDIPDSVKQYVPKLNGDVVAVRYDAGMFKSAVFGFSLYMMYKQDAVDLAKVMMCWFLVDKRPCQ
jgi:hypothetical protein